MTIPLKYKDNLQYMILIVNILNPFLKLMPKEKLVLASIMNVYYENRHLSKELIRTILANKETRKVMQDSVLLNSNGFNNMVSSLRKKNVLLGDRLNDNIIKFIPDSSEHTLTFDFSGYSKP